MGPISSSFSSSNISHPSPSSLPTPSTSPPVVDSQAKKVPFRIPPPSMSHGLAAHFLAGGENADLFIGSAKLEGFSQQHMLAYFRHVLENQSKSTGIEKDPKVERLLEEIAGALELEDAIQKLHTHHLKWEDRAKAFIQLMQERIQTLKPGQSLLIPGGWTQAVVGASGHAMLYRVTKTADDSFSFEIYNTGAGVEHHPTAVIEGRALHAQKILKKDLQTEQICSPLFWQAHYELKYAPAKDCGLITSKQVYNCFDLMGESFVETASQETLSSSDLEIRRDQTTGNCSYESLLAYTKIQLGKSTDLSGRSLYHKLKLGMQSQVLEEYFDYLTQQQFFTEPTSAEEASARLRILHLIRAEIHAVQRTLLREKSKRSLQLSSKEQQNIEKMIHNCNEKTSIIEETSIVCKSKLNTLFTQPDTLSIDSSTFPITVPPGKSISVDEALKLIPHEKTTEKCIPLTTTLLSSTKEIVEALTKVESLSDTILQDIPNVEDACWDTLENLEKILPSLFRIIQLYTDDPTKNRKYAIGDAIPAIKLMAICVKIVQKQKIPFLSETNLFSKKFLDSIFSKQENIISVSAKTHDDFFKSKKFLYDLSSEKCIFDEWLQLQPFEGSNQYDETFYSDTEKLPYLFTEVQKYLKKNDKLFQEFKEHIAAKNQQSPEQVPEIAVILEFITSNKMDYFLEFQQSLFLIFQHNKCKTQKLEYDLSKTNDKYKLKYKISDDSNLIPKIFHEISANYSTSLFQQDWDAIASEKELRNSCKNLLDFECNSIISCDDRSLSIFNALNFFTKNLDLLKNQTYRTFLLNVIFGRLNQEGFSLSDELKSNKKLGKSIISFVKKGLNSTINNPDQLGFFLLIRNSLIEFDEQFSLDIKVKKEIPLPSQKHLIKLIKSHYSTVLVHSLIKEESLTNYQEIVGELLLESIKEYSFFDYSYYKLNNKLFSQLIDKFFTSTKQLDLNKFLSKHLSHTKEPEEWVYQYPHASSKNIRLNINNFTATNLGTTESTSSFVSGFWENHCIKHPSFQEKFPLKNKKITEQNVKLSGFASGKYSFIFSGFFVDENGTRYFFKPTSDSSISTDSPEY